MNTMAWVILGLAAYGFLCLLVSLKKLLFGDKKKKQLEAERMAAAMEEMKLQEQLQQRNDRIIELEDTISKLQAACAPLPDRFYGGEIAYDYRDVTVYVPDDNFNKMVLGNPLFVSRSRYNRYDKDAVSLNYRGEELALLPRGKIQEMALDYLSRGDGGYAIISSIDDSEKTVKVHLGFYKGCEFPKDDE